MVSGVLMAHSIKLFPAERPVSIFHNLADGINALKQPKSGSHKKIRS